MDNKNLPLMLMRGFIFIIFLSALSNSIRAETICSYSGPDLSEDFLRLTDFSVTGPLNLKENDVITIEFKLQNHGQHNLKLGKMGIFVAARDANNVDFYFGSAYPDMTLKIGETVSIKTSKVLDEQGIWKIWPSYHLSSANGEKKGPDEWHVCSFKVAPELKDSDGDKITDDQDNCRINYNPKQEDADNDGTGDACDFCDDRDSDRDKIKNCLDECPDKPENYNKYQDEDGCPDEALKSEVATLPKVIINHSSGNLKVFDSYGNKVSSSEKTINLTSSEFKPLRAEAKLPCRVSGTLYNFTYDPKTVQLKFCEAEVLPESCSPEPPFTCFSGRVFCKEGGIIWYVNVTPRLDISIMPEDERLRMMNMAPKEQGIKANLSEWWRNVPSALEHDIEIDPVFSALHFYWLDEDGNVCYGIPGVNGQPGISAYIYDFSKFGELRNKIRNDESITMDELRRYQSESHMFGDTDVNLINGNIIQYSIGVWRIRENGKLFEQLFSGFSLPMDIYVTDNYIYPAFTKPVSAFGEPLNDCFSFFGLSVPSTGLGRQHPTKCHNKQNISSFDLIQACLEGRLNGSLEEGYFHILREPIKKSALTYQSMISCNGTFFIEPACLTDGKCDWVGTWVANKNNVIVMNNTNQIGYDFTFKSAKRKPWRNFLNSINNLPHKLIGFFQSFFNR